MRRFLALGVAALLPLLAAGGAGGSGKQFAVGSAKTESEVSVFSQHASFSAHNTGVGCEAKGQIVYDSFAFGHFVVKIDRLVIDASAGTAGFSGLVTKILRPGPNVVVIGDRVRFSASDSGLGGSDGKGDTFALGGLNDSSLCPPASPGNHVLTSGNVVIKATGPMLLP